MMAKRAKADAQDVKNRYATNKRHARCGMNDSKILRGWGAIELYAGESRKTLLRKGYPVQKDSGGSVWADSEDMDKHRVGISGNLWASLGICGNEAPAPLK